MGHFPIIPPPKKKTSPVSFLQFILKLCTTQPASLYKTYIMFIISWFEVLSGLWRLHRRRAPWATCRYLTMTGRRSIVVRWERRQLSLVPTWPGDTCACYLHLQVGQLTHLFGLLLLGCPTHSIDLLFALYWMTHYLHALPARWPIGPRGCFLSVLGMGSWQGWGSKEWAWMTRKRGKVKLSPRRQTFPGFAVKGIWPFAGWARSWELESFYCDSSM